MNLSSRICSKLKSFKPILEWVIFAKNDFYNLHIMAIEWKEMKSLCRWVIFLNIKKYFVKDYLHFKIINFKFFFVPFFEMTSALFEKIVAMYRFYFHDFFLVSNQNLSQKLYFFQYDLDLTPILRWVHHEHVPQVTFIVWHLRSIKMESWWE